MSSVGIVELRPERPVLLYDGDCRFCKRWVESWRRKTGEQVDYIPFQTTEAVERFPEIPLTELKRAVHLVQSNGLVYRGAEAVFRTLAVRVTWPLQLYKGVPGVQVVAEASYRLVASHRNFFFKLTRMLWGERFEGEQKKEGRSSRER